MSVTLTQIEIALKAKFSGFQIDCLRPEKKGYIVPVAVGYPDVEEFQEPTVPGLSVVYHHQTEAEDVSHSSDYDDYESTVSADPVPKAQMRRKSAWYRIIFHLTSLTYDEYADRSIIQKVELSCRPRSSLTVNDQDFYMDRSSVRNMDKLDGDLRQYKKQWIITITADLLDSSHDTEVPQVTKVVNLSGIVRNRLRDTAIDIGLPEVYCTAESRRQLLDASLFPVDNTGQAVDALNAVWKQDK